MTPAEFKLQINPKKLQLVVIDWLDADSDSGWQPHDPEADDSGKLMASVGWLVTFGYKFVTVSHAYNDDGNEWLAKHRVPIGMIENIDIVLERDVERREEE